MKMNVYERHAYLYSAWTALLVPCVLSMFVVWNIIPVLLDVVQPLIKIIGVFVSSAVVYGAVGFFVRELFRNTSKLLFQIPLFKEDETKMPTTEFLMWKNGYISHSQKEQVNAKMLAQYNYVMFDEHQEEVDELEARRNIVGAVGIMREATRGDKILLQCNYRYGYQRNMLGGLVWSFFFILFFLIVNYVWNYPFKSSGLMALVAIILQGAFAFIFMKYNSRNYARTLINVFISK